MKAHKLRINTANAITIGLAFTAAPFPSPGRAIALAISTALAITLILAAKNFLTATCNKLNENPSSLSGRLQGNGANCTPAAGISEITDGSANNNSAQCVTLRRASSGPGASAPTFLRDFHATRGPGAYQPRIIGIGSRFSEVAAAAANRAKRFILFNGNGVVKLVLGTSFPIKLVDKQRSLSYFHNLQMVYTPPPRPLYWWSFYNTSTFAARARRQLPTARILQRDKSREYVYAAIEGLFERDGLPGTPCLLKTICDVAQVPFHGHFPGAGFQSNAGVFHTLLNAIFTPVLANVDAKYLNAHQAGRFGVDCAQTFKACPEDKNWLNSISKFM